MAAILPASVKNRGLFSKYFLEKMLENLDDWKNEEYKDAFIKIQEIWKKYDVKQHEKMKEAQLEERLIKPILRFVLGHHMIVQETTSLGKKPDYLFFRDEKERDSAYEREGEERYRDAISLGDAKEWNVKLDGKPSRQVVGYLRYNKKRWGILTNGRIWRLFFEGKPEDTYYEVNLEYMIEEGEENFKYFYNFFCLKAFIEDAGKKPFLDRVLEGSRDYAQKVGDDLKERVYRALRILSEGFFSHLNNRLDRNKEEDLRKVQENAMIALYRMLFLLYAEGKKLLDIDNAVYRENYSLYKIKNEVWKNKPNYSKGSTYLWNRMQDSFLLINLGSEKIGIEKEKLFVPPYNGGLFAKRELDEWKIWDAYMAEAIDMLSRTNAQGITGDFIDYSTLEIRHLGGIYEGLLEYKLKVAEEDLVSDKKRWMTLQEYNAKRKRKKKFEDFEEDMRVRKGGLYLATDKGERKATGSYYTPDYIVDYIVKNTLGPIVDERIKGAHTEEEIMDAFLSIKVLDPAMGSGHFLVGAVEYLAQRLVDAISEVGETSLEIDEARRLIASHCIYGVDLNPMAVELAKVALWLTTISKDRPLSFLDHRLKCGNSLIGARLEDIQWHPIEDREYIVKKQREIGEIEEWEKNKSRLPAFIRKLVETVGEIDKIKEESIEDVKEKERLFLEMRNSHEFEAIKTLADLHTSIYFGNEVDKEKYGKFTADVYYAGVDEWKELKNRAFVKYAMEIAKEKRFFHWELEFPEVFFDITGYKKNPGFDAVIGNPPWGAEIDDQVKYLYKNYSTKKGEPESHLFMSEKAINLSRELGNIGFVTPNSWLMQKRGKSLRRYILNTCMIREILHLRKNIFKDAPDIVPIVFWLTKTKKRGKVSIKVAHPEVGPIDDILKGDWWLEHLISQSLWEKLDDCVFNIFRSDKINMLCEKIEVISEPLSKHYTAIYGVRTGNNKKYLRNSKKDKECYPCLVHASEIRKYEILWNNIYLKNDSLLSLNKINELLSPKIVIQYTRKLSMPTRLVSSFDEIGKYIPLNRFSYIIKNEEDENYSLYFLCSLLNSSTLNFYHKKTFIDYDIKPTYLNKEPIRRIYFTTPPEERRALLEKFKEMYAEVVG